MTKEDNGIIIEETIDGIPVDSTGNTAVIDKEVGGSSAARRQTRSGSVRNRPDPYIWGLYLCLLVFSVIELFSASSTEVSATNVYAPLIRHGIFLAIGFGIVLAFQRIHYVYFSRFAWIFAALSLALLVMSRVMGVTINGAQRAIMVAGFTIQPAEIVKLSVVVLVATILGRNQQPRGVTTKGVAMAAMSVLVFAALTWDNGLTNTVLLMGVSLAMFLIGNIPLRKIGMVLLAYAVAGGVYMMLKHQSNDTAEFEQVARTEAVYSGMPASQPENTTIDRRDTRKGRIARWLDGVGPEDVIDDMNRQEMLARFAQANGGLFGRGPGNSRESARLPLAFSDYIYSIIVEDTGFVGGGLLLLLYLCIIFRAGRMAFKCSRAFPAFLVMGCAVLIVLQALIHMAIVTGVAPVSGQPLPLISKGGTSVVVMSAAIGIMLSVSRFAVTSGDRREIRAELRDLPSDLQAENAAVSTSR